MFALRGLGAYKKSAKVDIHFFPHFNPHNQENGTIGMGMTQKDKLKIAKILENLSKICAVIPVSNI